MNPKIFVIAAMAIMVSVLGIILMMTSTGEDLEEGSAQEIKSQVEPISIELENVSILQVTERAATIEIEFKLDNPNSRSVIAQQLQYALYASDGSDEYKITSGEIGSRPEGMVDGSNYYTLLSNNFIILKDKIVLNSPGNSPELMSILESNNPSWRVEGDVFFNLSSMTSGQENEIHFESTK